MDYGPAPRRPFYGLLSLFDEAQDAGTPAPLSYSAGLLGAPAEEVPAAATPAASFNLPLALNFGGAYQNIPGGRVIGYGGQGELTLPISRDGTELRLSADGMGMFARGAGWQMAQNRLQGLGATLGLPSGDQFSIKWHDTLLPAPDTLPGATPAEIDRTIVPSRGMRAGWRREF